MNLTWLGFCNLLRNPLKLGFTPRLPGTFSGTLSGTLSGTFSGTLLNLTWLCTKASQTFSETFSGTSLNLTRRLHQCTPELFWAEDPINLRCWGKTILAVLA